MTSVMKNETTLVVPKSSCSKNSAYILKGELFLKNDKTGR